MACFRQVFCDVYINVILLLKLNVVISRTVMTTAQVKMLDDYSKEANGPNYTLRRNQEHHKETLEQMEKLRKVRAFIVLVCLILKLGCHGVFI